MKKVFSLRRLNERWGRLPIALALGLIGLMIIYLAYLAGVWHAYYLKNTLTEQKQQLQQLYQQLERLESQRNVLQVELDIEKSSSQGFQQQLIALQEDNYSLRENIAFYQKIMAPELEHDGVIIESLSLTPNVSPGHYHFSLALLQVKQRRQLVGGHVGITLVGRTDGKEKRFDLLELANLKEQQQQFVMRYFALYEGDFMLPDGFAPERIEVTATLTKGAEGRLERTFFWQQSLEPANNT
ncbi:hypothetical protein LG288_10330 [Idiomarina seosinensis]|uniref:DUF6776 family protein n=1 Tax=Idiomarina seosinensis TaxID=281739 RepID=UPI00384BE90B